MIQQNLKAIYGGVSAGLGSLYLALDNGGVSLQEGVAVAIAGLAAAGAVWGVTNAAPVNVISTAPAAVPEQPVVEDAPEGDIDPDGDQDPDNPRAG